MKIAGAILGTTVLAGCDGPPPALVAERAQLGRDDASAAATASAPGDTPASTPSASAGADPTRGFVKQHRTLDCGNYFGCMISENKLGCWGLNQFGQLGSEVTKSATKGRAFVNVPSPVAVAVGLTHACALTSAGDVYCWGASSGGAVGDGVLEAQDSSRVVPPTKVAGLWTRAVDLDAGIGHTCAVLEDGNVACWGNNDADVLGPGTPSSAKPVRVAGVQGAVEVATSEELTCTRTSSGEVSCWGRGKSAPEHVTGACARQLTIASGAVCEIDCAGTLSCWGDLPGYGNASATPKPQEGFVEIEEIRGGHAHFIARDRSGRVITWGANDSGQIGNGKPASWWEAYAAEPVVLSTGWKASAVCAGGITARPDGRPYLRSSTFLDTGTSCAATSAGQVYCWGEPDLDYVPKRVALPR
jgi:hypothetical protein